VKIAPRYLALLVGVFVHTTPLFVWAQARPATPAPSAGVPANTTAAAFALPSGPIPGTEPETAPAPAPEKNCRIGSFKAMALSVNDPTLRANAAVAWLRAHAVECSADQLRFIRNNQPLWLGTSDSPRLTALVDTLIEVAASEDPSLFRTIFATPEFAAAAPARSATKPRAVGATTTR